MTNEINLDYSEFKTIAIAKGFNWQMEETENNYRVWGYDGNDRYSTFIYRVDPKIAGLDFTLELVKISDFETNYKSNVNNIITQLVITQPDNNLMLQGNGAMSEISAGTTGFIDVCVGNTVTTLWLDGCEYWVSGATVGDWCEFLIVDIDNVLGYGSNFVLKQYVYKRYICNGYVHHIKSTAPGEIPGGVYLRVVYHSIGSTNPTFLINYDLNIKD